jgi:hypothetical protein
MMRSVKIEENFERLIKILILKFKRTMEFFIQIKKFSISEPQRIVQI